MSNTPYCWPVFILLLSSIVISARSLRDNEFEAAFGTKKPLGLKLDDKLQVIGFQRVRADYLQPAEANGWIRIGDKLLSVNEQPVSGLSLSDVARLISKADLPKVLRFAAKNGDNRRKAMEEFAALEGNVVGFTGTLDIFLDGVPSGKFPFVQAMFGRNVSCSLARVAVARPFDGCSGFDNAAELENAIVLVGRGGCAFASKAMNVQSADGFGVVVVNDEPGGAFRMPGTTGSAAVDVFLPTVMLSSADGRAVDRVLASHHHSPVLARLAPEKPSCDARGRRRAAARVAEEEEEGGVDPALLEPQPVDEAALLHSLQVLLNAAAWPASEAARRKLYFRLSKQHHPDMPQGSARRFELLNEGYEAANTLYGGGGAGAGVEAVDLAGHLNARTGTATEL